jgi:Transposase, Mutator family
MTDDRIALRELLEKSADADLLREMIGFAAERLMELEVQGLTGAAHGERSPDRLAHRNGYGDRAALRGDLRRSPLAASRGGPQRQGLERRQLALVEPGRAAALGPIAQALDPLGVEADHPVAQRLAVHAGLAGSFPPAHAIQGVGHAKQAARHPAIALLPCRPTQLVGRSVLSKRQPRTDRVLAASPRRATNHKSPNFWGESKHRRAVGWYQVSRNALRKTARTGSSSASNRVRLPVRIRTSAGMPGMRSISGARELSCWRSISIRAAK